MEAADIYVPINTVLLQKTIFYIHMARYKDQWRAFSEFGNECLDSIGGRKFLDQLSDYYLLIS
jgi:hypothetical protein